MLFNSLRFLVFFPAVVLVNFLLPKRARWVWLLLASYLFYMSWSAKYALLMLFSTAATWACGMALGRLDAGSGEMAKKIRSKKLLLALCLVVNLGILFFFKYYHFALDSLEAVLAGVGVTFTPPVFQVLLPVGISFYTFQAIGYTIDVYRGDVPPERNFFRYALFVSFFPQLVAGPIERSRNILPQLKVAHPFDYARMRSGLALMLWGLLEKMVIADRVAAFVNTVFDTWAQQGRLALLLAAVFFAIQIYCDFDSYSNIAIGAARVFGIDLMRNFGAPYLARSIRDFWRRWHISLSTWFRDYVYVPLGGSKKGKGRWAFATMTVFLLSGLWHGANWTFVVWGALHGVYQLAGHFSAGARSAVKQRLGLRENRLPVRLWQAAFTFSLVCFGYIFFRADNISQAIGFISRLFSAPWLPGGGEGLFTLGLDAPDFIVSLIGIAFLFCVDLASRRIAILNTLEAQKAWIRWPIYLLGLAVLLVFGIYGEGFVEKPFIYFQF